ncbi:MBL fold metallo-hydrolase [Rhodoferax sp.]|uniref:MBL fold metallo-hydrolase n=1 Tax=Rhodoferax sp. TaxID=50421 RepID=UPI002621C3BE|nr:MBL fold metallo-hydrolase [Rhodoferax sp.]MDD2924740.1 MBL fold metallo-hydrolase [Rhodoferax sp.]
MNPVALARASRPINRTRRAFLGTGLAAGAMGLAAWPEAQLLAQQMVDFVEGGPMPDIAPVQLSQHVWTIYATDGFPTPENRGMMSNVSFVVTSAGVVILDSGSSVQIGRMAIRMIKKITSQPVVAVFNTHYHGDHWLGNHAFVEAYGEQLPIYALPGTMAQIKGYEGSQWHSLMMRWTNQATAGTKIVPPNHAAANGQVLQFGEVTLKLHFFGKAHTAADLSIEVVPDKVTAVGDLAMANRIANIDDGSYPGTFKYFKELTAATGDQLWLPGHGVATRDLLQTYGKFLAGIWEPCLQAVKDGKTESQAKAMVLADPRVASRAKTMQGFDSNIGKYTSLAYLEAEKEAF